MNDTYVVGADCAQRKEFVIIHVPKGQMRNMATGMPCPNCGHKGYIKIRE